MKSITGSTVTVSWTGSGNLEVTSALQGASTVWTSVSSTSPYVTAQAPAGQNRYYRVRAQ